MEEIWLWKTLLYIMHLSNKIIKQIKTKNTAYGGTCVCRVPKSKLEAGRAVKC